MSDIGKAPRPEVSDSGKRKSILRFLYTQNPFYLISVAFVLNGTGYWFRQGEGLHNPWPLMALICGYIAMMALTAFVIVRFGNVWDDARSIFLVLPILFVELSLTFDDVLISDRVLGASLLLIGLLMSVLTTEGLLLGLRIRLPALFRLPMHAMLSLLFLYPLVVVAGDYPNNHEAVAWKVFAFSPLAAAALLTLIPAIRRGRDYVRGNGTVWMWPLFPWILFAILGCALGVRTYALGLSFDPMSLDPMQLQGIFGSYFLVPILLAAAVLLMEMSIVEDLVVLRRMALAIPFACVLLAIPTGDGMAHQEFLTLFSQQFGSPVFATLIVAGAIFSYAAMRRIPHAADCMVATLLMLAVVSPQTTSFATIVHPQQFPLWLITASAVGYGIWQRNSRQTLIGLTCGLAAVRFGFCDGWTDFELLYSAAYLFTGFVIVVSIAFRDEFAEFLKQVGGLLLVLLCVVETALPHAFPNEFLTWSTITNQAVVIVISFICAYGLGSMRYFCGGLACGVVLMTHSSWQFFLHLRDIPDGRAIGSVAIGIAWFVLAATISAYKARILHKAIPWLPLPHQRRISITQRRG